MEARELRIGNIVIRQGEQLTVNGADIKWFEDGSFIGFEPIPLTEEWLLKLGFRISKSAFDYSDGRDEKGYVINDELSARLSDYFRVYWRNEKMIDWVEQLWPHKSDDKGSNYFIYVSQYYVRSVRYVHELQNFYFTLTSCELTIK